MTDTTGPQPFPPRDRLFALIASIPGSGTVDWCGPARALLDEIEAAAPSAPADRGAVYRELADRQTQLAVADDLDRRRDMATARRQLVKELRRMADEEQQAETKARECPPGVHSMFDFCPGDCGEPVADEPACTCASAGDAFVPAGHYADCPCPEARQQHGPAAPVAGQPPADTREETVHGCPPDGSGLTPCCGRTPFELPRTDRMSTDPALVTCTTPPAVVAEPGKENSRG